MTQRPVLSYAVSIGDALAPPEGRIEVSQAERARLAKFLRIENLDKFSFDYHLEPISGERFRLTGKVAARLTQLCVITLDPVDETVDETVSVECWPQDEIGQGEDADDPAAPTLPDDPPVAIVGGKIDLGAFAAEVLASAINPYPRKAGVAFDWRDAKDAADGPATGPFAKLAELKPKR